MNDMDILDWDESTERSVWLPRLANLTSTVMNFILVIGAVVYFTG